MPTRGDSQRYSVDYSNTMWGSDINFIVMQARDVWIRTLYDRHRFVVRGNLGWIEADNLTRCRQICVFRRGRSQYSRL